MNDQYIVNIIQFRYSGTREQETGDSAYYMIYAKDKERNVLNVQKVVGSYNFQKILPCDDMKLKEKYVQGFYFEIINFI